MELLRRLDRAPHASVPWHVLTEERLQERVRGYHDRLQGFEPIDMDDEALGGLIESFPEDPTEEQRRDIEVSIRRFHEEQTPDLVIREECLRELREQLPVQNIEQFLRAIASEYADLPAVVGTRFERGEIIEDGILSYKRLREAVQKKIEELRAIGLRKGHKIVVISENRLAGFVAMFAGLSLGAAIVPWTEKEKESCMEIGDVLRRVSESGAPIWIFDARTEKVTPPSLDFTIDTSPQDPEEVSLTDPAMEMFTTGTGGDQPSLVRFTHENLLAPAVTGPGVFRQEEGATAVHGMPLYHIYGFEVMLAVLSGGAKVVLCSGKDLIQSKGKIVKKYRPRFMANVPLGWNKVVEEFHNEFEKLKSTKVRWRNFLKWKRVHPQWKRVRKRLKGFLIETFVESAIEAEKVRIAEEEIASLERTAGDAPELLEMNEAYWDPVRRKKEKLPQGVLASLKRAIGRALLPQVRQESGLQLREGYGIGISGAGELSAEDLAELRALDFYIPVGYGLTQTTAILGMPNPLRKLPAIAAGEVVPGATAWKQRHPEEDADEICAAGLLIARDLSGRSTQEQMVRTEDGGEIYEVHHPNVLIDMMMERNRQCFFVIGERIKEMEKQYGKSILLRPIEKALKGELADGALIKEVMLVKNIQTEQFGVLVQVHENLLQQGLDENELLSLVEREVLARAAAACRGQGTSIKHVSVVEFTDSLAEQQGDVESNRKMRTLKGALHRPTVKKMFAENIARMWTRPPIVQEREMPMAITPDAVLKPAASTDHSESTIASAT